MISLAEYKAKLVGIEIMRISEAYTSKASALDFDPIPDYAPKKKGKYKFGGIRGPIIKGKSARGLYRTKDGFYIHSDVNAAFNIGRKQFPNAFGRKNITQEQMLVSPIKVSI